MYEDKTLVCKDCGKEFVFTAGEQEFYAERGFQNEPQRCKECRDARRTLPSLSVRCIPLSAQTAVRRGEGAVPAQERSPRLLQRVLCQDEGAAGLIHLLKIMFMYGATVIQRLRFHASAAVLRSLVAFGFTK
jgi:hypothetical protein